MACCEDSLAAGRLRCTVAIAKATLPKRVAAKATAFQGASAALVSNAQALAAACKGGQADAIAKATSALHTQYEGLTKIFE